MEWNAAARTHIGCLRKSNQDGYRMYRDSPFYAVADGMGGLDYGEVASRFALDQLSGCRTDIQDEKSLTTLLDALAQRLYKASALLSPDLGMGTTLTLAKPFGNKLLVAHVGDSQLYSLRGDRLCQLTEDHTLEARTLRAHPDTDPKKLPPHYAHTLTRCLGQRAAVPFDVFWHPVSPGERFLLCSDGLGKLLPLHLLKRYLHQAPDLESLAQSLLDKALELGAPDNVTLVVFEAV